jgi:tetratricopeptide (TPR) repeat protein
MPQVLSNPGAHEVAQLVSRALVLHRNGNLDDAESLYRQVLAIDASHAQVLGMLGMLQLQRGHLEAGIEHLQASLQARPEQPDVLNNLGYALQIAGRLDEALANLDKAIALSPRYGNAYYNRGNVLHDMARYEDALASYASVIELHPDHLGAYVNMGNSLKELKRLNDALASYDKAIVLAPYSADVHCNRGFVLQQLKHYEEALASYDRAIRIKPDYAEAHYYRGLVLHELKRYDEGLASLDRALNLATDYAEAHYQRALTLLELKRYEEALNGFERAISIRPDYVEAYARRGWHFLERGEKDMSENSFAAALNIDPRNVMAIAGYVELGLLAEDDPRFKLLESLYAAPGNLPVEEQVSLSFAMGKALERMGKYDEAFVAYEQGNRLFHFEHPVKEQEEDELLEWVSDFFTQQLFNDYAEASSSLPAVEDDQRTPIFIVGMPRSGTTLIEQVLSSHSAVFGAGELTDIGRIIRDTQYIQHNASDFRVSLLRLREMGRKYLDRVWKLAPDARYITDKLPMNFRYLGLIHLMFPNAKIIHAMRDPMDCCFSCYALHFTEPHDYAYDMETLGRYYLRYQKFMQHWHGVLPPGRILDVHYEEMVGDLEGQVRRLLDYLELPWEPACLEFHANRRVVQTASLGQVRQPIYSSSIARWKHFEKHLVPLAEMFGQAGGTAQQV